MPPYINVRLRFTGHRASLGPGPSADRAHIAAYSIDAYGDPTLAASTAAIGIASFNGVALSQ